MTTHPRKIRRGVARARKNVRVRPVAASHPRAAQSSVVGVRTSAETDLWLRLIGLLKLVKAAALLGSFAVVLNIVRHDPIQTVIGWALKLHVDPANSYLRLLLAHLLDLDAHRLELIAAGVALYVILFGAEGVGLLLGRLWAEYLTVVETAGFIPLEMYEIVRKPGAPRVAVLAGNVAIAAYLAVRLRHRRHLSQNGAT